MPTNSTATPHRILIIDDNAAIHEDFRKILQQAEPLNEELLEVESELFDLQNQSLPSAEFAIDFAFQGQEGVELVRLAKSENRPYTLAFVDGRMPPGWDGIETIGRLWEVDPELQVVFCTAFADYSWQEIQRNLGTTDGMVILKKPFDTVEVLQLAHTLARKWDLNREVQGRLQDLDSLVRKRTHELAKAHENLARERNILRDIFEDTLSGYWDWNLLDNTEYFSPTFKHIFGYADHEMENSPEAWRRIIFPEDLPGVHEVFDQHVKSRGQVPFYTEVRYRHKDGSTVWIICAGRVIEWAKDGSPVRMVGCHVDITRRKQAEEELQEQKEQLTEVADMLPGVIYQFHAKDDGAMGVSYVSRRAVDIFGFPGGTRDFFEWFTARVDERDRDEFIGSIEKVVSLQAPWFFEGRFIKPSGERIWFQGMSRPVRRDTELVYNGVLFDVTERKQAEEEREKLQSQLLQAQKMESVGILAGGVAHDFNNLLHVMRGNIELLDRNLSSDPQSVDRLKSVTRSLDRAARLVQQLLLFSRKADFGRKRIDVNREVREVAQMLERTIPKMVSLKLHLDPEVWPILADPVQIEQVLLNMANNSVDAMPEGGRLIIETSNVNLDGNFVNSHPGATEGRHVLLTVSDTGWGMDKATLNQIYDPFFTTKEVGQGTGLGMASVYGIVKAHEGYIQCSSEPGQGATFRIYLPAGDISKAEPDDHLHPKALPTTSMGEDRDVGTILVVEDEPGIRDMTREALEDMGYVVLDAGSGEQALEVFRRHGHDIDLVLLDLNMPGMGGLKCLEELRRLDPEVKVIIASGYSANVHAKDTLSSGAKAYLAKPYRIAELATALRDVLDSGEKNSHGSQRPSVI